VSIFHVTPFGGRWRNGARTPGRRKFLFVHVANDAHRAKQPSIQLPPQVQKMKAELIGRARPGVVGRLNDQPARS
jgi:hypothetical protein